MPGELPLTDTTSNNVVGLNGAKYAEPCVELLKARGTNRDGVLVFERWCYKHHHWLNHAPPQKTILDEIIEDATVWSVRISP